MMMQRPSVANAFVDGFGPFAKGKHWPADVAQNYFNNGEIFGMPLGYPSRKGFSQV